MTDGVSLSVNFQATESGTTRGTVEIVDLDKVTYNMSISCSTYNEEANTNFYCRQDDPQRTQILKKAALQKRPLFKLK